MGHDVARFEWRTKWASLNVFTTASTLVTWRWCSQPCTEDVIWANGMEGGHVHGRDEVRSYWTREWTMIDPHVEPVAFAHGAKGEVVVEVHQLVRDLNGNLLADRSVTCFESKTA